MVNKAGNIGREAENAVVRQMRLRYWPHSERRRLMGVEDQGDINPGVETLCIEVKGGNAARTASDNQVAAWMLETERERRQAGANIGVLVLQRKGIGPANADRWWALFPLVDIAGMTGSDIAVPLDLATKPVRMLLGDALDLLGRSGYGDPRMAAPTSV